jgi:hypothetical protein
MATRNGKIANLPNDIREQLNLRLLEGETGRELAAWLNGLPEVQSILHLHFNGAPISEVNLTSWRQGGYLQWFTERECFDSARALADGDSVFAENGLTAERLLNILTLRYGQLLLRWDHSSEEGVTEAQAFSLMAKKARILQGISRSVLAIHRLQSQSPGDQRESPRSSASSPCEFGVNGAPVAKPPLPSLRPPTVKTAAELEADPALNALLRSAFQASQHGAGKIPKILSGQITAPHHRHIEAPWPRLQNRSCPQRNSRCRMTRDLNLP